ncbi:MAG TPA: choice-of-anchor B family protein [Ignavibacteria bacterium]|nr:choice-of-anchor B family protein [Ignavibacteria bacterium]HMR39984.1 choice-of-anchor B family protein [Ignavibacteria bacterium]
MRKFFLVLTLFSISCGFTYSQLPNQNTYLLRNLDQYSSYSALWGYTAPDGREYALLGTQVGTSFVDITDSANIHEVDSVKGLNSSWREMKTYSHYAYIVSEATNSGLQIVDLQYLPDSVHLVKTWSYSGYTKTHSIQQSGHYIYLNGGNSAANGGVTVLDVSDPENPVKQGQWTTLYVHDCRILNDTIWASNIYTGETSIIDATNKNSLGIVRTWRSYPTSEVSTHNSDFSADRKYLYTTNEISSPNGKLNVWNIEDLNNITFIREWQPTGITTAIVHNIECYDNIAVIAHYRAGIRILDISTPSNPVEVAWYDTYPSSNSASYSGCWGVYKFPSGKIIGSDISNGLFVIKTTFPLTGASNNSLNVQPADYSLNQNYPNPFNPSTKISFSLKQNSDVKLKIFNTEGREIAELINDTRDGGNYEVVFDASEYSLSSGTYFYTINISNQNQNYSQTKKMFLIK